MSLTDCIPDLAEGERLVPLKRVAHIFDADIRTAASACQRHGIPVYALAPSVRGITPSHLKLLLAKSAQGGK